jgi:hypothetical protein
MLTIRRKQLEALEVQQRTGFRQELVERVQHAFPGTCQALGAETCGWLVAKCVEQCESKGWHGRVTVTRVVDSLFRQAEPVLLDDQAALRAVLREEQARDLRSRLESVDLVQAPPTVERGR